jgi:ATP-dependent Lhr-like helicase
LTKNYLDPKSISPAVKWFESNGWKPFDFQLQTWEAYLNGYSGLVNAPTGSGKTYATLLGVLLEELRNGKINQKGLKLVWITPIRALAKEIKISSERALMGLGIDWDVQIRSGDTKSSDRSKQWNSPPQILITTPESIHVLMAKKGYSKYFSRLSCIVVDEWHELLGSKRGVQTELLISRFKSLNKNLRIWGISATIGNMDEAMNVLHGVEKPTKHTFIKAEIQKEIEVVSLIPDKMEKYPWAGHIGLQMAERIIEIIHQSKTTLIFTNTRAQCEIWYQKLLEIDPDLSGLVAMHHGSISRNLRDWVEDALYDGRLKAVVCTSSLDLGVDFRPVETIIQVGSPKGVARFIQRAGRSGHQPGAKSKIYFSPTNSLELIEAAALRDAIALQELEDRIPYVRCFDVLVQYLMTLAVSEGFRPDEIYKEISKTHCYSYITYEEWLATLAYLVYGSQSLQAYDEYQKVVIEDGVYKVTNKGIAMRHRMSIGTIVSDAMMQVKYVSGKRLGTVEEWFITQLSPGDVFWFAGRALELVRIKDMTAQVKNSKAKTGRIPSYMGGRLQLSSELSDILRKKIQSHLDGTATDIELKSLIPLFEKQKEVSVLPKEDELLIEYFHTKEGYHLVIYPFEGRFVHEGMGALIAKRISRILPISFSIAMNDYGFELLSDQEIDVETIVSKTLFSTNDLLADIQSSLNAVEMSKRKFRDIAVISGLVFTGFPGKQKKERHLQSSSQLLYGVFQDYEPDNILYRQTFEEVMTFQLEEARLRSALERMEKQYFIYSYPSKPTPLSFSLIVDVLREKLTSEKLEDRIKRMLSE